jgi:molecular chaperone GrpE
LDDGRTPGDDEEPESPPAPEAPAEAAPEPPAAPSMSLEDALTQPPEDMSIYQSYEQRARLAEDRLSEVMDAYRALKSETEGHRERITKNLDRRYDQRRDRLLVKFIEILDNLDRALEAAEKTQAGESLIEGLILVRTQLLQTLKEEGLERIPALGHPYDPHVAEGVDTQEVDDPERHHVVVKELQRGYLLNGRVARAARVVVGEYRGPAAEPAAAEAAPPPEDAAATPDEPTPERPAPETSAGPAEPETEPEG